MKTAYMQIRRYSIIANETIRSVISFTKYLFPKKHILILGIRLFSFKLQPSKFYVNVCDVLLLCVCVWGGDH